MERQKKYVAIIMNRVYTKDGDFLYVASHPEIGTIDEKNNLFRDRNCNEYLSLLDTSLMMSEVTDAYYGLIELDKICEITDDYPLRKAISNYAFGASRNVYYVSTIDNVPFVIPIDLNQLKEGLRDAIYETNEENDDTNYSDRTVNGEYKPAHSREDSYEDDMIQEEKENISSIILKMLNGDYSLDELREISRVFKDRKDEIEGLLESIDIQIEASENGESKNKVKVSKAGRKSVELSSNYINIDEIFNNITKTLVAQDEPLRRVITEIIRKEQDPHGKRRGLLITGETGVGKTLMMSLIADNLKKPFFKIDSTQLTVPGYVGRDIEEFLWDLYIACGRDKDKAESAIIFFDEIDKKGSSKKEDVFGKGVLNVLLPFIEGSVYNACADTKTSKEFVKIDSSKMTVIFGGAFTDVYKNLSKNDNVIGFNRNIDNNGKNIPVSTDDFIEKAKMPDEFMGRVSVIKLNDLDLEAIKRIILESDESAIKLQERLFKKLGVKLTPGYDYINAIAERALDRKTGARGLNTVVDESTWVAYDDAYSNLGKYSEIILGKETVDNPKQYKKILRGRSND